MFKRKSRTERIADEAWDNLVSAMETAGDTAKSVGRTVGRRTSDLASDLGKRSSDLASDFGKRSSGLASDLSRRTADLASDWADEATNRINPVKDEAWSRASGALDALSGRKPRRSWGWIALALVGGIAIGMAVAASAPRAIEAAKGLTAGEDDVVPTPPGFDPMPEPGIGYPADPAEDL